MSVCVFPGPDQDQEYPKNQKILKTEKSQKTQKRIEIWQN